MRQARTRQTCWSLFALNGLLEVRLYIAIRRLRFAADILNCSFGFQFLVTDKLAGDFLHFAFYLFDTAFGLILVHGLLLILKFENIRER